MLQIPSLIDLDVEERGVKTEEVGTGGMQEGNGWWCCLLLVCLITLFLIKNCSRAAIINLPTQACILNGALQTSNKKWGSSLNSQVQRHYDGGGFDEATTPVEQGQKRAFISNYGGIYTVWPKKRRHIHLTKQIGTELLQLGRSRFSDSMSSKNEVSRLLEYSEWPG